MVNFDCYKCIHHPVCMYKQEVAIAIELHNKRSINDKVYRAALNCKYYVNKDGKNE